MRKFVLVLIVATLMAVVATTSQAGLLSDWTFDGTTVNAVTGTTGTLAGTGAGLASLVAGKIGSGALFSPSGSGNFVGGLAMGTTGNFPSPEPWGTNNKGLWEGTVSYWTKTDAGGAVFFTYAPTASNEFNMWTNSTGDTIVFNLRNGSTNMLSNCGTSFAFSDPLPSSVLNNGWHHIVATWKLTTGASGTGTLQLYEDGAPITTTVRANTYTSAVSLGTTGVIHSMSRLGRVSAWGSGSSSVQNSLDDFAAFNNQLAAAQVKALFDMGNDTLNYNATNLEALFNLYVAGSGSVTIGSNTWVNYGSNAGGFNGTGAYNGGTTQLALGSAGGVQIVPEPSALALLTAGVIGLLVFAWRKRK